ncbi:hypothetical protein ACFQ7A_04785 [Streptomyces sp. NPDC056528]|uniref:hypothetical protein n=1 Tax=Streptomyces sp. NPDC056528 TaxID=3345854 RepID=UPI0036B06935
MLLVPQCGECRTPVLDDAGRELTVEARLLPAELRDHLTAVGWDVTPGDPKVNRGPSDPIGEDRLSCPACMATRRAAVVAAERRLTRDLARPRVRHVGMADRLGDGWTLTQREGDDDIRRWLVEHQGQVRGAVNRYRRTTGGLSTGWEAHRLVGTEFVRVDAIGACQHRPGSSFLWSARDLAAWGVAARPAYDTPRPEWATRAPRKASTR